MVCFVDSTPEYSHIPRIILKSEHFSSCYTLYSLASTSRVLLASIRDIGQCPCPRCRIPLSRVHNIGTVTDMKQRKTLARVDDEVKRSKVVAAREIIYEQNFAVDNIDVELLLKEESLVPTNVSLG